MIHLLPLLLSMLFAAQDDAPRSATESARSAQPQPPSVRGADLELLRAVRAIAGRVEAVRGESFARPPIAVRAPDELRQVAAEIRALNVLDRERLAARGRAWADLGLGGVEAPARIYTTLAADLAGIGFDPAGNRLLVAPDRLTQADFSPDSEGGGPATVLWATGVRIDEPLVGHLLMHVRQRERLGRDWMVETTDGLLARAAWAEGEANVVAVRYLFAGLGLADEVLGEPLDPAQLLDGGLVPRDMDGLAGVEGEFVRFVYREGFAAAARAFRSGGWAALDAAMASRTTTRDLLQPGPAPPSPSGAWAEPEAPTERGLRLADRDALGQLGAFALVSSWTGKDNLALQAADGWSGDRLYRWERDDPDVGVTLWLTRWRDEKAAADFDYALGRVLEARLPGRPPLTLPDGQRAIQTSARVYRLERQGKVVRLRISARELDALEVSDPASPPIR